MDVIYREKLWGGKKHDFYSGSGSHLEEIVNPYIQAISSFLDSFEDKLVVCDLGCGDFNVGSNLVSFSKDYVGVDIVEDLIERNKQKFKAEKLRFECLDIVTDTIPPADCILARQVLQHLTNDEVTKVLAKLKNYKYLIITEHVPFGDFVPNKDKKTGPGTRLYDASGVDVAMPPFNLRPVAQKELLRLDFGRKRTQIVTTLYQSIA